jgi:signal transduction histidine kinase
MSGSYYFVIPLLAALGNLILAAIVLRRDRHNELNQAFAFATVMMVFWNLNIFVFYASANAQTAFFWSRFFRVGTLLMPASAAHFFYVFSERRPRWAFRFLILAYAASEALIIANSVDLLVSDVRRYPMGFYYVGTPLYRTFTLLAFACAVVTFYLLVSECFGSPSPHKRFQARLWLLGTSVAMPLGLTNLITQPGIHFPPLGNLANTVYIAVIAYGIVRHRLMDIDLVVTKSMAYAAVSFVLIAPAFAIALWLQRLSFGLIHPDFSLALLAMFAVIAVLFPTLRLRVEAHIARSLFREKHEHRSALIAFTRSIVRILDRDRLVRELATTLRDTVQLDRIAVALYDDAKRAFVVRYAVGPPPSDREIQERSGFIAVLTRHQDAALRRELEATATLVERRAIAETCGRNGWEVCIPLMLGNTPIGFIGLGHKRNFDAFSAEDLEVLGTLAAQASVALENARLYDELKKSQDIIRRADRLSALGTLAAGIAHEVRNPLVSIQTFFQLAPERLHDEEFFTTFLDMTAKEVNRISDLITELLSFARSPTRSLGAVDLNDAIDRIVTLLEPEARKHHLTLVRELSEPATLVRADSDQIKQVFINLILNAIQATQPGGVVTVTTRSVQRGGLTAGQFEINDTGRGIPQDELEHIFDPFFTTKDQGTGLGLAIVHQIVMEHGGSISVESKLGCGTRFLVDLPALATEVVDIPSEALAQSQPLPLRYERPRKVFAS